MQSVTLPCRFIIGRPVTARDADQDIRLVKCKSMMAATPDVLLRHIATYLSADSLKLLAEVCKRLRGISEETFKSYLDPSAISELQVISYSLAFNRVDLRKGRALFYDRIGLD